MKRLLGEAMLGAVLVGVVGILVWAIVLVGRERGWWTALWPILLVAGLIIWVNIASHLLDA